MNARPVSLVLLLTACTAPSLTDSIDGEALPLPGPGLRAELRPDGLWLEHKQGSLSLSTLSWGREGAQVLQPLSAPREGACWSEAPWRRLQALGCEPSLERPMLGGVERWRRLGEGAQQAWTLTQRPDGGGLLVLDLVVSGATPWLDGEQVRLELDDGGLLTYAGLLAWDDQGHELPAWMSVEGDLIHIWVDDLDAVWPLHIDPVVSTASTTLTQSSTDFGIGVTMGNFNGGAYSDVGVGARFGTGLYGEAFTYHGSSSGVSTTYARKLSGADYYGKFGEYVEGRGDINGDGYDDFVVSEFYSERFFVYKGTSSGVGSTATSSVTSSTYGLGRGLAMADWNNDGYDDVMAGAQEPTAEVFKGSSSGLNTTRYYTTATLTNSPSVSTAGDVNSDGYDEFIYGVSTDNAAYVMMGSASPPSSTKTLTRTSSSEFGFAVGGGGDIDGDGYDDVIVGDPTYSSGTGRVTVFYGSSSGLSTSNYDVLSSPTSGTGFGYTVEVVGDVNGDGYDDIAVSDDYDDAYAYVFHGASTGIKTTPVNTLNIGDANFGYDIAGGEDVNGDGYDDVIFGSIGSKAYIHHGCADADNDGECATLDCNDSNSSINTSATEICDSVDNDCDGLTDDADSSTSSASKTTWYRDADGDGYGTTSTTTTACSKPTGYVSNSTDCNDSSSSINPGATETTGDSVDSNCDSRETCYVDADNDNYRLSTTVSSSDSDCSDSGEALASDATGDCNDSSSSINPGATETTGDGVDSNCDSAETCYVDADNDNYRLSTTVSSSDSDCSDSGEALSSDATGDCNDSSSSINPGATEITGDNIDSNCDSKETCYADADNDSYRTTTTVSSTDSDCSDSGEALSSEPSGDCNDSSSSINPGATEITGDSIDSNCDSSETCYADADNDNYRTTSTVTSSDSDCSDSGEALSSETSGDCDDTNSAIKPGATEICDGKDNDCDSLTDSADSGVDTSTGTTYYDDDDSDGYGDATDSKMSCDLPVGYVTNSTDCNDTSSTINPGATEITGDSVDSNCDNKETCYVDADNDNYRTTSTVTSSDSDCADSGEALSTDTSGDCNDSSSSINPGATEVTADGVDSNCDSAELCYVDADNDGYRLSTTVSSSDSDCSDSGEALSSEATGDCDDTNSSISPVGKEICDGADNDCDGLTDSADPSNDNSTATTYYSDSDSDGYGVSSSSQVSCDEPSGYALLSGDCDDTNSSTNPGVSDTVADGVDNNCDGVETCYQDLDNDGYRTDLSSSASDGDCSDSGEALASDPDADCDDTDLTIYPSATDTPYDDIDQNCDGLDSNDLDGDGQDAVEAGGEDCDDSDNTVYAGATDTWYDGVDSDCAGNNDYDADVDGTDSDAYGGEDCDDADPSVYGGAADAWYDGVDSDCAGNSDFDADADGHDSDSYGGDDCDDNNNTIYTGAVELADELDNDCDGYDENHDGDGDGLTDLEEGELGTDPDDADTDDDTLNDGEEVDGGTSPLLADTDSGGVDDGEEVERGSDPINPDDDDLPLTTIKGSGLSCSTQPQPSPRGLAWLLALAPFALLRRLRRSENA